MRRAMLGSVLTVLILLTASLKAAEPATPQTPADAIKQLDHEDAVIRRRAVLRLAEEAAPSADAVAALTKALDDEDDGVRLPAAAILWRVKELAVALDTLTAILKDGDVQSRREAAVILGGVGKPAKRAVPDLVALASAVPAAAPQVRKTLVAIGPEAVPGLVAFLTPETPIGTQIMVCDTVRAMGPIAKEAVPALVKLLKSGSLRTDAAKALGAIGPEAAEAVPLLVDLTNRKDRELRHASLTALGQIGPRAKDAIPTLVDALPSEDGEVAATSLAMMGEVAAPELEKASENKSAQVRRLAIRSLATFVTLRDTARQRVIAALTDAEAPVRGEAVIALGRVVPTPVEAAPALLAMLKDDSAKDIRPRLAERVAGLDGAAIEKLSAEQQAVVLAGLGDEDAGVRYSLALAVGKLKTPRAAVSALMKLLADPTPRVRYAAAYGLGRYGPAAKEAIPALKARLEDEEETVRNRAAASLKQIEPGE